MRDIRRESYLADVTQHLETFGLLDKFVAGQLRCFVCNVPISEDNLGIPFRDGDDYQVVCEKFDCLKSVTHHKD